jgi:hemoglobin
MAQAVSTSISRRSVVAGLALTAAPVAVLAGANSAYAQAKQTMPEKSLYERLGAASSPSLRWWITSATPS